MIVEAGKILEPKGNLIDGRWQRANDGATLPVYDPATGEQIATIPSSSAADMTGAVEAARRSFKSGSWSRIAPSERGRTLWRLAQLIRDHTDELAYTETRDSGKPIVESREDVAGTADAFEYYAGAATKIVGESLPLPNGQYGFALREPVGVVGIITPWNFPLYIAGWKVAPALACGNSVVLKPPSLSSLTCLALGDLALAAGLPAGVLNVVTGRGEEVGEALASNPDVDVLAFTGGTSTGKRVMTLRAGMARPVQLELGGKSPDIVFDDADLDTAIAGAAFGIFYTQGENCNAGSRVLLQRGIYEEFLARLAAFANRIRVLMPLDERSQLGSLVSQEQLDKVERYVAIGLSEGARLVCGGRRLTEGEFGKGFFYPPTILADVPPTARVFQEEIFGPVLTVTPFDTVDEAIELANGTEFGLAAGAWTASAERAMRCVQELQSGYVWINTFNGTPVEVPFGGVKSSGFGRDCGMQAIDTFTSWKSVVWATSPYKDWYKD
jgi:acyl-CoA reductase-like NAD-dependent aldehyde dehydrogenase